MFFWLFVFVIMVSGFWVGAACLVWWFCCLEFNFRVVCDLFVVRFAVLGVSLGVFLLNIFGLTVGRLISAV